MTLFSFLKYSTETAPSMKFSPLTSRMGLSHGLVPKYADDVNWVKYSK